MSVNLDSIKLLLPNDCLQSVSKNLGTQVTKKDKSRIQKNIIFDKLGIRGMSRINIDLVSQKTTIELSAKILRADYIKGINKDTITQVIDEVNSYNIVEFNSQKLIDEGQILRLDVTDNLNLKLIDKTILYRTLSTLPLHKKIKTTFYNTKTNLGIVFKGDQVSKKDRMIFYDKTMDLTYKDKSLHKTDYTNKVLTDFKDIIRVEQNLTSFKQIRDYYKTINIKDILLSDTKANYLKFDKMTNDKPALTLFTDEYEGMTFKQIRNILGDERIIIENNYDWQRILNFVKRYNSSNWNRYTNKELIHTYKRLNEQKNKTLPHLITQIKQLLYA